MIAFLVKFYENVCFKDEMLCCSLTNKVVALKEIQLQQEEGTPFTAIREGVWMGGVIV